MSGCEHIILLNMGPPWKLGDPGGLSLTLKKDFFSINKSVHVNVTLSEEVEEENNTHLK